MKPYVCDERLKSFCTATELKHHQLKHSDYKQFCCGSCGKYFKHKETVVRHFNRCSVKLGYVHIFAKKGWDRELTICGQLFVPQSCYCWLKTCQWDSRPDLVRAQIQTVATHCVFEQWTTSYSQCFDTVWLVCACVFDIFSYLICVYINYLMSSVYVLARAWTGLTLDIFFRNVFICVFVFKDLMLCLFHWCLKCVQLLFMIKPPWPRHCIKSSTRERFAINVGLENFGDWKIFPKYKLLI